jgi:indole-3-glycerol phosphate synthase
LRKDFVIDEYQVHESKAMGADCILLIVAAMPSGDALATLQGIAAGIGMDSLVEVHSPDEMEIANAIGATMLGINNRDLRTFETDISVTERLAKAVGPDVLLVSESGIRSRADVERVRAAGARAMLVGEGLANASSIAGAVRELLLP